MSLIKKNISDKGIVFSDIQTKGRGRYGNKWISIKGNIFCSLYKKVNNHKDILKYQYKILKIVKNFLIKSGLKENDIQIKEPNDILIKNKIEFIEINTVESDLEDVFMKVVNSNDSSN